MRRRLSRGFLQQRVEQLAALEKVARFEHGFGQLEPGWQIVAIQRDGAPAERGSFVVARQTLQHDGIEVHPVEPSGCQRLRALIRLVRRVPQLPRVQPASQVSGGVRIRRLGGRRFVRTRQRLARGRRERRERKVGQRRNRLRRSRS